jgi:hypothetical protein
MTSKLLAAPFNDAHSDDRNGRLVNQAFQTLLELSDDEELRPSPTEPFASIVDEVGRGNEADRDPATPWNVVCFRRKNWVEPNWLTNPLHQLV